MFFLRFICVGLLSCIILCEVPVLRYGRSVYPSTGRLQIARDEDTPLTKLLLDEEVDVVGREIVRGVNDQDEHQVFDVDSQRLNHCIPPVRCRTLWSRVRSSR